MLAFSMSELTTAPGSTTQTPTPTAAATGASDSKKPSTANFAAMGLVEGLPDDPANAARCHDPPARCAQVRKRRLSHLNHTKEVHFDTASELLDPNISIVPSSATPALLTNASSRPCASTPCSRQAAIESGSVTSNRTTSSVTHASPAAVRSASERAGSLTVANARQPALAAATAVASPIPEDAPAIRATGPSAFGSAPCRPFA